MVLLYLWLGYVCLCSADIRVRLSSYHPLVEIIRLVCWMSDVISSDSVDHYSKLVWCFLFNRFLWCSDILCIPSLHAV